jgi:hypothetical protein
MPSTDGQRFHGCSLSVWPQVRALASREPASGSIFVLRHIAHHCGNLRASQDPSPLGRERRLAVRRTTEKLDLHEVLAQIGERLMRPGVAWSMRPPIVDRVAGAGRRGP